jgi:hypothetical protein
MPTRVAARKAQAEPVGDHFVTGGMDTRLIVICADLDDRALPAARYWRDPTPSTLITLSTLVTA